MAEDEKKTDPVDPDTLSDEEFMKLDVPVVVVEDEEKKDGVSDEDAAKAAADLAAKAADGGDTSTSTDAQTGEDGKTGAGTDGAGGSEEGSGGSSTDGDDELTPEQLEAKATADALEAAKTDEEKAADIEAAKAAEIKAAEVKKTEAAESEAAKTNVNSAKETLTVKKPEEGEETDEEKAAKVIDVQAEATSFFKKMSAPFKADGKEIQIRTAEEGIRLMQMGVNYSRRMEQMKPLREMDAMLTAHGLNTPEKLNELIDLSKGGVPALQKHLKKHNIDPLDLDASKGGDHTTPNYQADPKDVAFQYAIDTTLQAVGGKELLGDVNKDWDETSKEALRENPGLFAKLLEQKETGVYSQIQKELLHQRTMGYLAGVPFLQAYEQVGIAMQKAGVFDPKEVQKKGLAPIDSGSRKVTAKKADPNPNLSSAKPKTPAKAAPNEPDYLSMTDADFLNLAVPV